MQRTHRADLFTNTGAADPQDEYSPEVGAEWLPGPTGVPCNVQVGRGSIKGDEGGRAAGIVGKAFFPHGTAVDAGTGFVATPAWGGPAQRFVVVGPPRVKGPGWDTEVEIASTMDPMELETT